MIRTGVLPVRTGCNEYPGLHPRKSDEIPVPTPAGAFKRSQQPVGMVLAPEICPPTHAGAQLRRSQRIRAIVGVEASDAAILDMGDEQAATPAVVGRAADTDLLDFRRFLFHNPSVMECQQPG